MTFYQRHSVVFLICCAAAIARAQGDFPPAADRSIVKLTFDVESHLLRGESLIRLHAIKDSLTQCRFALSSEAELLSVRDSLGKKIDNKEESVPGDAHRKEISITLHDSVKKGETVLLKISYEVTLDTTSTLPSFINEREILLSPESNFLWRPVLPSSQLSSFSESEQTTLEATLPSQFTVVCSGERDSTMVSRRASTWRFTIPRAKSPSDGILFCASRDLVTTSISDSTGEFSLLTPSIRFDRELAGAVLHQLHDAFLFFSSLTGVRQPHPSITLAVIGNDDGRSEWMVRDGVIVGRTSAAYSRFDSAILLSGRNNKWVHALAHSFGVSSADSSYWFDEGWANYLTTKYFLSMAANDADAKRAVRLDLFSTTLDFYPSQTLAEGRHTGKNETGVFFKKGACIFLMLEYILGEDEFGAVIKEMVKRFGQHPAGIREFQSLCEEAYGSTLDWFFKEWVYETGFPEFILSTEVTQTNRGNFLLKATISQRGDVFTMPVDLVFSGNTRSLTKRAFIERQDQQFEFILPFLPSKAELDPDYYVLRWVPRLRLLAHARTAVIFRVFDRDLSSSEREATLILQLDPNNLTGWNNIALFALGKSAVIKGDLAKGEEYFRRASALEANEPTQLFSVLSVVRLGNVLEMEGKRDEAIELYKLSITLAERNPILYGLALSEARKCLREKFVSSDEFWYGEY